MKINQNNIAALNDLCIVYMYKKEFDKAEKVFRIVYQMNPNNPNVCYMLGKVLSMNNRTIPEAISMLTKAVSLMPTNIQAYVDLGNLYLKTGDKKRAIAAFEKAVELNPDLPGVKAQLDNLK